MHMPVPHHVCVCAVYSSHRVRASPSGEGSTMFTAHSRATSQSLTTWRAWRSRRRSTRSNGFLSRTPPTSCSPPTVSQIARVTLLLFTFGKTGEMNLNPRGRCIQRPKKTVHSTANRKANKFTFDFAELSNAQPTLCRVKKHHPEIFAWAYCRLPRTVWVPPADASQADSVTRGFRVRGESGAQGPTPRRHSRPSARRCPADCGLHAWVAAEALVAAGADGGGSCGDASSTVAAEIKGGGGRKKKKHETTWLLPTPPFGEPEKWDVTGVFVMENWKKGPRWLFFLPGSRCVEGGRGARSLCSRETSSTCRLISESSQRPPFIIMAAGCCPATCQIGCPTPPLPPPPASIRHLSCTAVSCDPSASQCVFPSVCVSASDKTVKLWKISERDKRPEGYNLKDEDGRIRNPSTITSLRVRSRWGWLNSPPHRHHHPHLTRLEMSNRVRWRALGLDTTWLGSSSGSGGEKPDETIQASGSFQSFGNIKIIKNHHFYNILNKKN